MNKVVRDILVEDLREALAESKQREESMRSEIDELRYNLWMCRKNAYQSFMATHGVLPDGYESQIEELEHKMIKKEKSKK